MNLLLQIAIRAAIRAGDAIMEVSANRNLTVETKTDFSPVTNADIAANEVIMDLLCETGIPILSEEGSMIPFSERRNWSTLWIVDPLDGTKEFIRGNGQFTVNIALVENNHPSAGVIYCPVSKILYFADSQIGSFKIQLDQTHFDPLFLIEKAEKLPIISKREKFIVVASSSHINQDTLQFIESLNEKYRPVETVSIGSSLKLCLVAEGVADMYPRFGTTMEWDIAAGHAICLYSGAQVFNWNTCKPLTYNKEQLNNDWFIARR